MQKDLEPKRYYFDWAASAIPEDRGSGIGDRGSGIRDRDSNCNPQSLVPFLFANPSSPHREGRAAREALENARARCAAVLNVSPETIYFTSGGTESNCIVLHSFLARKGGGRIIASEGEHSSVTENLRVLERMGKQVGTIPIDSSARLTQALLSKTLEKYGDTRCVAIMAVNNETGTVNDMAGLKDVLRNKDGAQVHLHCDMVQAVGKIPIDIEGWDVDSAAFSAHKIGGPRGIGLLYLRRTVETLYTGGGQERNVRPGTENVAGALALAACLEKHALPENLRTQYAGASLRWKKLLASLKNTDRCRLIPAWRDTDDEGFSPYIVQAAFKGIPGEVMVRALDDLGFAVSTGSACSSAKKERPVLAAMGLDDGAGLEGIRISQGPSTTDEEIDLLTEAVTGVLKFL
jgi:cysteine desulfurase